MKYLLLVLYLFSTVSFAGHFSAGASHDKDHDHEAKHSEMKKESSMKEDKDTEEEKLKKTKIQRLNFVGHNSRKGSSRVIFSHQ